MQTRHSFLKMLLYLFECRKITWRTRGSTWFYCLPMYISGNPNLITSPRYLVFYSLRSLFLCGVSSDCSGDLSMLFSFSWMIGHLQKSWGNFSKTTGSGASTSVARVVFGEGSLAFLCFWIFLIVLYSLTMISCFTFLLWIVSVGKELYIEFIISQFLSSYIIRLDWSPLKSSQIVTITPNIVFQ